MASAYVRFFTHYTALHPLCRPYPQSTIEKPSVITECDKNHRTYIAVSILERMSKRRRTARNNSGTHRHTTRRDPRPKPDIKVYVISLVQATERHRHMATVLRDCPFPVVVVDAVDGDRLPDLAERLRYARRRMRPGEVGCFLSHVDAIERISNSNECGLILEDDVVLKDNWEVLLQRALAQLNGNGLLFCNLDSPRTFFNTMGPDVDGQFSNFEDRPFSADCVRAAPRLNMHAYAIFPQTARRLLSHLRKIETAIDVQLHFDRTKIDRYALRCGFARQAKKNLPSYIRRKRRV